MSILKRIATIAALTTSLVPMAFAGEKDIVDTAVAAGKFTTLAKLVTEAGLVDTLKGKGPFTVFAPTDEAFAKVPKPVLQALLKDKKLLVEVLTYHVIAGKVMSTDLKNGMKAKTVEGENITVKITGKKVMFNNANLVAADVKASNGVIHVIDTVIVPPSVMKKLGGK